MKKVTRTTSKNKDFISLVAELDTYLSVINGGNDDFFKQFNKVDLLNHVVLVHNNGQVAGCGAIKEFNDLAVEVKRMYVKPTHRRKGIAQVILTELETWAKELGYDSCVLETAKDMTDAVAFYKKLDYKMIPNYGQYEAVKTSVCFQKNLV